MITPENPQTTSNPDREAGGCCDPSPCSAFSDSDRLTWLIRESAYGLIDPRWAREGEDPQSAVRERIDKHMMRRPNAKDHVLVGLFADRERNALMTALRDAALTDTAGCSYSEGDCIYLYVENTPKTSLVSELVDQLHRLGYCIKPNDKDQATRGA